MESLLWIRSFKLFYEKVDALFDDGRIPHSFVVVQRCGLVDFASMLDVQMLTSVMEIL